MAATDAYRCIQNAPFRAVFPMRDTSGQVVSGATSLVAQVSVDSAVFGAVAGTVTEIGSAGIYYIDLTAAEVIAANNTHLIVTSGSANTHDMRLPFEPSAEAGLAQAGTAASITLRSGASATDDLYNGLEVEIVRGTGLGQFRTAIDYTGSTKIVTVDRNWATNPDSTSVYKLTEVGIRHGTDILAVVNSDQFDGDATAAANLKNLYTGGLISSSVNDATPTATSWIGAAGLSASDDFYNTCFLIFTSGTLAGLARQVTDYTGSSLTIAVSAFPVAPANGNTFVMLGTVV